METVLDLDLVLRSRFSEDRFDSCPVFECVEYLSGISISRLNMYATGMVPVSKDYSASFL